MDDAYSLARTAHAAIAVRLWTGIPAALSFLASMWMYCFTVCSLSSSACAITLFDAPSVASMRAMRVSWGEREGNGSGVGLMEYNQAE